MFLKLPYVLLNYSFLIFFVKGKKRIGSSRRKTHSFRLTVFKWQPVRPDGLSPFRCTNQFASEISTS